MNLSNQVKSCLTMLDILPYYGFQLNRSGFMNCPFHTEKTPSLKVYDNGQKWHCFGCGKGGSILDFVMELFSLSLPEAIKRLNSDFCLNLSLDKPVNNVEIKNYFAKRKHQQWLIDQQKEKCQSLCKQHRDIWSFLKNHRPTTDDEAQQYAELIKKLDWINFQITAIGEQKGGHLY